MRNAGRDRGLTLVELVMAVTLGSVIAGVSVAVMITAMNVVNTTRTMSGDSADAGLIAELFSRDALSAGGTDPVTLAADPSLGVSTTDWGGCTQDGGELVARFAWVERGDRAVDHPAVVTWAHFGDGRLVRRACVEGAVTDGAIGEQIVAVSMSCRPGPECDATTSAVALAITGSGVGSATGTLHATLRPTQVSPSGSAVAGRASPLLLVGDGAATCPELSVATRTVVIGDALLDDACGSGAVDDALGSFEVSGSSRPVGGLRDPYAARIPAAAGCPGMPEAPAGTVVHPTAVSLTGVVDLVAGHHVFCDGITIEDGAQVRGSAVFIQVAGGDLTVSAGATVELTAPTTGPYANLLLSVAGGGVQIAGGPTADTFRGVIHAPASLVEIQTDLSVAVGAVVADRLVVAGAGIVRIGMPIPTPTVSPAVLPVGQVGVPYAATTFVGDGGTAPYSWTATGLPTGLTLTPAGLLDGAPTTAGTSTVSITVIDGTGAAATVQRTLTVRAQLAIAAPASLPSGQTGTAYPTSTVTATGGTTPYTFSATGLPPGLTMSSAGLISGTPGSAGDFAVTVVVTDAIGAQATRAHTLSVRAALAIAAPSNLPSGTVGTPWSATTVTAAGGTGPYAFSATGLPPGLAISLAGVISGTPTTAGNWSVTVTATDAAGVAASRSYVLVVSSVSAPGAKPFAALRGFQVFVEGATTLATWEIEGAVATGGDLTFRNYQRIAHSETSSVVVHRGGEPLGLLVGGGVDLATSGSGSELTVHNGWFVVGKAAGQSFLKFSGELHLVPAGVRDDNTTPRLLSTDKQSDLATTEAVKPNAFDFAGAFASLRSTSSRIAALTPTSCPAVNQPSLTEAYGNHTLTLRAGAVNVWNVTIAEIGRINNLDTNAAPGGSTELIINVTDSGSVTLPVRYWNALATAAGDSVIWNFPNATSLSITQSFTGSLLAPNAAVRMFDVNVAGDVVAKSLDYRPWSTELAHFDATIPCIG